MRNGRAYRLLRGLGLGCLHTAAAALVGLWLTPFLLHSLGSHDYGLWLLGTQVVFYLGLMDLGVVAVMPREVASASGLPASHRAQAITSLIGQTATIVVWQLPGVALVGCAVVWLLPPDWAPLRGPLGTVVLVFVLTFPLRIFTAVLQGLQDLAFVGTTQLTSWAVGTACTVAGMYLGFGLYSLTWGWIATQTLSAAMAWFRLARTFPDMLPARLPSLTLAAMREQIGRGAWIIVSQLAQVLLSGTDILIIGKLLGPHAIVPYACTAKLITLLANQPQMFMQLALPALSELRTSASREQLFALSSTMTQAMLLASGAVFCVVLATNAAFVDWWVGDEQFGGQGLTLLLLTGMLVRHFNTTTVYTLFCFGNERRLALTTIAEGIVGITVMFFLIPPLGLYGAAIGPLAATCLVGLPNNLRGLARDQGTTPMAFLVPLGPWLTRMGIVFVAVAASLSFSPIHGLIGIVVAALAIMVAYIAIMVPLLRRPPLGPILRATIQPWADRVANLVKRRAHRPVTLGN